MERLGETVEYDDQLDLTWTPEVMSIWTHL